jgi:hypothetical protein
MSSVQPAMTLSRRRRAGALLAVVTVLGFGMSFIGCDKPDWLSDFERHMDDAIPKIENALDQLAADLPKLVDPLDRVLADQTAHLDQMLREQIDGLNIALSDSRGQLDAALVARAQQLANFATLFAALVRQLVNRDQKQLTIGINEMLAMTDATVTSLLGSMGLGLKNVRQAGNARVGDLYSLSQDVTVRVVAGVLLLLGLLAGGIAFLIKTTGVAKVMPVAAGLLCIGAGLPGLLSADLRGRLVPGDTVVVDHDSCPESLTEASAYLVQYGSIQPLPGTAITDGAQVIRRLLACLATTGARAQFDLGRERLAGVRRLLNIDRPCRSNGDCGTGQRCNLTANTCTDRCDGDQQCQQGLLCHDFIGKCLAPCGPGALQCPAPSVCRSSRCVEAIVVAPPPPPPPPGARPTPPFKIGDRRFFIKGGIGWATPPGAQLPLRLLPAIPVR